jgi:signal transduction histidine kinase
MCPIVALSALAVQRNAALSEDAIQAALTQSARAASDTADAYLAEAENELAAVAAVADQSSDAEKPLLFGGLYLQSRNFLNIFTVDDKGQGTSALFFDNWVMPSLAPAALLPSGTVSISSVTYPGVGKYPSIIVAVPQSDAHGKPTGAIVGFLSLGRLQVALQSSVGSSSVLLLDEGGRVIGQPDLAHLSETVVSASYPPLVASQSGSQHGVVEFSQEGGDWLAGYSRLAMVPWTAIISAPRTEAGVAGLLAESGLLLLATAAIGSVIAAYLLSRWVLRPLARLTDAARSLAMGDLSVRAVSSNADETHELAIAFNSMADGLTETIANLNGQRVKITEQAQDLRRLLERTVHIQEVERNRLAVDIHDDVTQLMVGVMFELDSIRLGTNEPVLADRLDHASDRVRKAIAVMRRLIFDLKPGDLTQVGLVAALENLVADTFDDAPIESRIDVEGQMSQLTPDAQITMYRVAQEALANVRQHSGARKVVVRMCQTVAGAELYVSDDGRGFWFDLRPPAPETHLGLTAMNERAQSVGGQLKIVSKPGAGTTVSLFIPTPAEPRPEEPRDV